MSHRANKLISDGMRFFGEDLWRIRLDAIPWWKTLYIRPLRIVLLGFRAFNEDQCMFRASALTFYSLLSIVPVLAMAFGIAKGFGFQETLERQLHESFYGHEEVIDNVTVFANSMLESTKGGLIAGVGVLILFWTVIRVLGNVESAFNHILNFPKARSMGRKVSDYMATMFICTILLVLSSTLTVVIKSQVTTAVQSFSILGSVSPAIFFLMKLLPYCAIWLLFTFLYMFLPNGKISLKFGLPAAIAAGTFFQLFQWAYLSFQIGVTKYNAIYGSFAALPLFLVWLQISWLIVLFGAELLFSIKHEKDYEFAPVFSEISYRLKMTIMLQVVHFLVKRFCQGTPPVTSAQIVEALKVPKSLLKQILMETRAAGIVSEICPDKGGARAYQPASDVDLFTVKYVIDKVEQRGLNHLPMLSGPDFEKIKERLNGLNAFAEKASANVLLKNI
ncbi:MAG: YihY family inner membrane protein [Deltaproteobacteria bacterium]|nr:YihY family inner membrane protein [Deltaproteobacteria bacterium]